MPLPTTTPAPAHTILPQKSFVRWTPAGGTAVDIYVDEELTGSRKTTLVKRMRPGADGLLRPDRIVETEIEEMLKYRCDEFQQANMDLYLGSNRKKTGTAQIFVIDPDDASGKVAAQTNAFAAYIRLEGDLPFKTKELSRYNIEIHPMAEVVWSFDANAPA